MIRIAAIDDHPMILGMIEHEINQVNDMQVVGTARHGSEMKALVRETNPDVLILDLVMSTGVFEPVLAVQQLLRDYPTVKVMILTGNNSIAYIRDLIKAGALGYVLKDEDLSMELPKAIRSVYRGKRFYSPAVTNILLSEQENSGVNLNERELQVLRYAAEGYQNDQISETLGISEQWTRNCLSGIYGKLGVKGNVNSRVAAIKKARELGLIPNK